MLAFGSGVLVMTNPFEVQQRITAQSEIQQFSSLIFLWPSIESFY